jgi:membrane associated rhomboid family serine protease
MGLADREYVRNPSRPPVGVMQMWSVTTWIIVINVAVFVLNLFLFTIRIDPQARVGYRVPVLWELGYFSVATAIGHLQVWRFITFQFLHAGLTHILFNMFALYFFGPLIEAYLGRRRFLAFYLLSGVGGGLMYVVLWALGFFGAGPNASNVPLVGASAGIFGVLVAAARIAPDATVLIYGSIPMRLKTMAWVMIGIAVFTIFTGGNNAGGEAAHLGGAAIGFLLISNPRWLNPFELGYHSGRRRMTYR